MSSILETQKEAGATEALGERFLTFLLGKEIYGIPVLEIQEIIRHQKITRVPHVPHFLRGVINLRGKVVPVMDMRLRFGLPEAEVTNETCIVVIEWDAGGQTSLTGLMVDKVEEVLQIPEDLREPPPTTQLNPDEDPVFALGKLKEKVVSLVASQRLVNHSSF